MMPDMTGMEMAALLRRNRREAARRLVFLTGGAYTADAAEFLRSVAGAAHREAVPAGRSAPARARAFGRATREGHRRGGQDRARLADHALIGAGLGAAVSPSMVKLGGAPWA